MGHGRAFIRWRRLVAGVLGSIAILAILYGAVANTLLQTRLLRSAISGPAVSFAVGGSSSALLLDYGNAYSFVPGRVHLEGLTIRGRDSAIEWRLTLDHADVCISLFDLLRHTFHATRVRASGFTIRVRPRLDRASATPDVVGAQPPIAGFSDPPLLDDGPVPPPLTDAQYNLWTIHLEEVDLLHAREIWIHTIRAAGDARVRGRWLFHPQRWLDVGPATVDVSGVDLWYGSAQLTTNVSGTLGATVHPFELLQASAVEILDHVSYDGSLAGRTSVANVLRLLAPRGGVRFTRWEGPFDAHVVLDHGKLAAGTRVWTESSDSEVEAQGLAFDARTRMEIRVERDLATVDTRVSGLRVSHSGAEQARVGSITATIVSRDLQLAHAFKDARFTLDVAGAETNDVGVWKDFLPSMSTFTIRSGLLAADGHADGSVAGGWAAGAATISADDISARLGGALLAGKLGAHIELRRGVWESRAFDLSGSSVNLRAVSARAARGGAPLLLIPSVSALASRLSLAPSVVSGQVSIDLPHADLVDLGHLDDLLALPSGLRVEGGGGYAKLQADVDVGSGAMHGKAGILVRGLRARVGKTELLGDLDCELQARRVGNAGGSTDFSGSTLSITSADAGSAPSPENGWWGNMALREATMRTAGGLHFDVKAHMTAKDATPATVLVSQNMGVPTWATNVFRMPVLDADAELRVDPSSLEVRSLIAHGGSTSLKAEYAKRDGRTDGAVLMDLGWLDLGYDLADGAGGLVLIGPERWFGRKTAVMRDTSAAAKLETQASEQLARYASMTSTLREGEARSLAAQCALEVRSCDGASIEHLLRAASDSDERDVLSGVAYAPSVVAAAKGGRDGPTLDPLVVGAVAEALKVGGPYTLDNIPDAKPGNTRSDSETARGKVIAVTGHASTSRREGRYTVGTLTNATEAVYFVTPFAITDIPATLVTFRGVFVQLYTPANPPSIPPTSLVLVGAFSP
jgi:hypothetical protein